jgi:hypothetical protein
MTEEIRISAIELVNSLKNLGTDRVKSLGKDVNDSIESVYKAIDSDDELIRCENHCPKCNAGQEDITWGEKDFADEIIFQTAYCQKCHCEFTEISKYSHTEID